MGQFKKMEGRPPCGICGKPADVQNKLPNGQHIWRKSKDGSFRCYSCHDNTTNQVYLADKYIGSKLNFTTMELKPATIRLGPEANVKAQEIRKNNLVKKGNKSKEPLWGLIIKNELTNPKRNGKLMDKMAGNYLIDSAETTKKNKKKTNDKYRSKKKAKTTLNEEIKPVTMDKETLTGQISQMPAETITWLRNIFNDALADKKQTDII